MRKFGFWLGALFVLLSWTVSVYIAGTERESARLAELQKKRHGWSDSGTYQGDKGAYELLTTIPAGAEVRAADAIVAQGAPFFTPTLVKPDTGPITLATTFRSKTLKTIDFNETLVLPLRPFWLICSYLFVPGLFLIAFSYRASRPSKERSPAAPTSRSFLSTPEAFKETAPDLEADFEHEPDTPDALIYGRYVKGEFVGKGAMGEVFRCRSCQAGDSRDYALKILLGEWSRAEDFRARFEREADICRQLVHRNLVRAYDRGEKGDQLWMVMEFLEGCQLQEWVERTSPSQLEIVELFLGLCDGLTHAHEKGVVHRDLKPENVLVCSGRGVITDFGLARGKQYATITKTNTAMGTPIYMPPEQITGGQGSPQGDIYSLGCVLYQCLAGRVPFPEQDVLVLLTQKLNGIPPAPLDSERVSEALSLVVSKMMEANPLERFHSAADVREALQSCRSSVTR